MPAIDLEIGLHRREPTGYAVDLRFNRSDDDAQQAPVWGQAQIDADSLRANVLDPAQYGKVLSVGLFSDPNVRDRFRQACAIAQALASPLRIRLFIDPNAADLHGLRWETLRDPETGQSLVTSEHVFFSRYLSSQDFRPEHLRPRRDLRALVAVANPANIGQYERGGRRLVSVDVNGELDRVKAGLGNIPVSKLPSGGSSTLNNIITHLRDGYDIFYLVCHGALIESEAHLFLEEETGKVDRVSGKELVTRLSELQQRPRLVVLASCQSAGPGEEGAGDNGVLAALGPRLAEAGIPAVLAMQGSVTMQTVTQFMPVFFKEVQQDGQIDRAMAVARGIIRDRPDSWMPVLFMRLKGGRIWWYNPGFTDSDHGLKKWPALLGNIYDGCCTPILGPGLNEFLLGSRREVAQRWAEQFNFPMAAHQRDDLPQVAQFLAVEQDIRFPRRELREYIRQELLRRYGNILPSQADMQSLNELMTAVWDERQQRDAGEPYKVLARLPFSTYVTTNPDQLLARALVKAHKDPQIGLFAWQDDLEPADIFQKERTYRPDKQRPLVYHFFGHIDDLNSLVLTEDDYFDYLIGVGRHRDLIPPVVRQALTNTGLLFLGFQMDEWNFRVLFRSIMRQEGGHRREDYAHVAVQIDPGENRFRDLDKAHRYLESYFQKADISIYWGSVDDFTKELRARWTEQYGPI
jgi:hypothetical protein